MSDETNELDQHVEERATKTKKSKKAKPAAKKPAAGKAKKPAAVRGKLYELTAAGEKHEFTKQAAVMAKYLKKGPKSLNDLASIPGIKAEMKTTQDPKRPLAFLLNEAKNAGLVRFAKA